MKHALSDITRTSRTYSRHIHTVYRLHSSPAARDTRPVQMFILVMVGSEWKDQKAAWIWLFIFHINVLASACVETASQVNYIFTSSKAQCRIRPLSQGVRRDMKSSVWCFLTQILVYKLKLKKITNNKPKKHLNSCFSERSQEMSDIRNELLTSFKSLWYEFDINSCFF